LKLKLKLGHPLLFDQRKSVKNETEQPIKIVNKMAYFFFCEGLKMFILQKICFKKIAAELPTTGDHPCRVASQSGARAAAWCASHGLVL
jgi:hypothetical protein